MRRRMTGRVRKSWPSHCWMSAKRSTLSTEANTSNPERCGLASNATKRSSGPAPRAHSLLANMAAASSRQRARCSVHRDSAWKPEPSSSASRGPQSRGCRY